MLNCPGCGAAVSEWAARCPACGAELDASEQITEGSARAPEREIAPPRRRRPALLRWPWRRVAALLAFTVVALAVVLLEVGSHTRKSAGALPAQLRGRLLFVVDASGAEFVRADGKVITTFPQFDEQGPRQVLLTAEHLVVFAQNG